MTFVTIILCDRLMDYLLLSHGPITFCPSLTVYHVDNYSKSCNFLRGLRIVGPSTVPITVC